MNQPEPNLPYWRKVFHPTDFSEASDVAFAHALKLALLGKGTLSVWHLEPLDAEYLRWSQYPRIRGTLERWEVLPAGSTPEDVAKLGITVQKIQACGRNAAEQIVEELRRHRADLLVLATHQRSGMDRILHDAVAEPAARSGRIATLFIPQGVDGFVNLEDGSIRLRSVLIPIDKTPWSQPAIDSSAALADLLDCDEVLGTLVHVGNESDLPAIRLPDTKRWKWEKYVRQGDVADEICRAAEASGADLIVLATAGHDGLLDALRGSTSERILRCARVPVLAVPAT